MLTLLSTIISFLAGGLPKLLDFFQDKQDKSHELRLLQAAKERELEMAERGYIAQQRLEEIKTEQVAIQASISERAALMSPLDYLWHVPFVVRCRWVRVLLCYPDRCGIC